MLFMTSQSADPLTQSSSLAPGYMRDPVRAFRSGRVTARHLPLVRIKIRLDCIHSFGQSHIGTDVLENVSQRGEGEWPPLQLPILLSSTTRSNVDLFRARVA